MTPYLSEWHSASRKHSSPTESFVLCNFPIAPLVSLVCFNSPTERLGSRKTWVVVVLFETVITFFYDPTGFVLGFRYFVARSLNHLLPKKHLNPAGSVICFLHDPRTQFNVSVLLL